MKKWKTSDPILAGWYEVPRQEGKAYWTGTRWASKVKGKTLVPSVGRWREFNTTPWFPSDTQPTRKGEYECQYDNVEGYMFRAHWNGNVFLIRDSEYPDLWNEPVTQAAKWRGITALSK